MSRVTRDALGYLFIIGFCILMLAWAIPTYTPAYPGYGAPPALVPNVAVSVMLVMAVVSIVRVLLAAFLNQPIPPEEREFPEDVDDDSGFTQVGRVNLVHLVSIMVPCALLVVAIDYVGYAIASFAFLMLLQFIIGSRRWLQSIIIAVVLVSVLYIIMRYGFGVPVPGPQLFE
ncbi:MAG: tripartite tricarboxylate transporter TctB family protein [Gammaproteobacteria bacterium]|nr:tripartite tricarboxylate transporter TctB family protein [Gammaproteobacteria bacterium]